MVKICGINCDIFPQKPIFSNFFVAVEKLLTIPLEVCAISLLVIFQNIELHQVYLYEIERVFSFLLWLKIKIFIDPIFISSEIVAARVASVGVQRGGEGDPDENSGLKQPR